MPEAPASRRLPYRTREALRFRDMDLVGHVNNSIYATLFEQNRVDFQNLPGGFCEGAGQVIVVATPAIDFLRELHWPGTVEISLGIGRLGASSFDVEQEILRDGVPIARARCTQVLINVAGRRPVSLSAEQRARLSRWESDGKV